MQAIDTGVLLRLMLRDNLPQTAAAEAFIGSGAWVSIQVLTEAVAQLAAAHGRAPLQLATAIGMLLDHRSLTVQDADLVADALRLFRADPAIPFSACVILQLARRAGHLPLGTFHRSLAGRDGVRWLPAEPDPA